jgi:ubiquinone/menaquinone biosynthesis C-methylase UbiE
VKFKEPAGRAERLEYADECRNPFSRWFGLQPDELFGGKDVLDLGSGFGGRPVRFSEVGAKSVIGLEISDEHVYHSQLFNQKKGTQNHVRFVVGTGEKIPLPDDAIDLVTMYDVMEHVTSPKQVLSECYRVLRPGGMVAAVFPPYYAYHGGSHLHGYASSLPGLNLIFSNRSLRSASLILFERQKIDYQRWMRDVTPNKLWNLNGLTVRGFHHLVRESPFHVEKIRHLANHDRRLTRKRGLELLLLLPAFWIFEALAQVPFLREGFCARIAALLRK